jgi:subtilisin family serine protease
MKKFITLLLLAFCLTAGYEVLAVNLERDIITDQLKQKMDVSGQTEMIRVNIKLKEQFDSQRLMNQVKSMSKIERRAHVIEVLKDFSRLSQEGVIADLNDLQQSGSVNQVTTLWIANIINCYASPEAIIELAKRNDIASIDHDEYRVLIDPEEGKDVYYEEGNSGSREITWNVIKINADDVWALGFNGDGIVVSVIDTGVNYEHVDLADHVWTDPDYPFHGYDFVNNDNNPMDDHGHGTHCSGTVAGDGTAGSQTGVAPEATIMCCKVLDAGGGGTESGVWNAIEFSVEHGADVMSLSLGWQHSWGVDRETWRAAFDNSLAAGILASVAAGNEGDQQGSYPIPDNVRTPGDLPPAWLHPDQTLTGGISGIICVGATDVNDNLADFSSRGPCDWSAVSPYNDYPFQPEMGLIRPDICAPGVNIKSLDYASNTGYASGWSGTSMATPANAGMIALMLQKNNLLSPAQINQTIEETTVVLVAGKNNNSGSGRIDALAALNATAMPGPSYHTHIFNDATGNNNGVISPAEQIQLTLAIANFSDAPVENVTVTISTTSPNINFSDNTEYYGNFELNQIIEMTNAFAFEVAADIPGGEVIEFLITASTPAESWESGFVATAEGIDFVLGSFTILDYAGNNNGQLDPGETVDILIETSNNGQMDANDALATLVSANTEITINVAEYPFGTITSGQTVTAYFNITVASDAPVGTIVELDYEVVSGEYALNAQFFEGIGLILEDFETADFSMYDWQFSGNLPWTITDIDTFEGFYCAKSGGISNGQSSEMSLTMVVTSDDSIAFYRKVSSQNNFDFLRFFIDEVLWYEASGETTWNRAAVPVSQGTHTFRWVYVKNNNTSDGSDCAWIDYIDLPVSVAMVTANAGNDSIICEGVAFHTNAVAENYNTVLWESNGEGSFDDETRIDAIYTPAENDVNAGSVTISLTVFGPVEQMVTDDLLLGFTLLPAPAGEISGESIVCMGHDNTYTTTLIDNSDIYEWILSPAEAGVITGDSDQISILWAPEWTGMVTLTVQGINECGGGGLSQEFPVQVDDCTGLDDILTGNGFTVAPNPSNGLITVSLGKPDKSECHITILNLTGEKVFETIVSGKSNEKLDVSELKNGLYFILMDNGVNKLSQKLIIQK